MLDNKGSAEVGTVRIKLSTRMEFDGYEEGVLYVEERWRGHGYRPKNGQEKAFIHTKLTHWIARLALLPLSVPLCTMVGSPPDVWIVTQTP
jgi:hypothetical protein